MSKKLEWIVTTAGERPVGEIAKELAKNGFHVDKVLDAVGCITGTSSTHVAEQMRSIRGVADVTQAPPAVGHGLPNTPETR